MNKALQDFAPGDRVCWSSGVAGRDAWGTITKVNEQHFAPGVNGPVFTGVTVTLDVPHWPTWDSWGWPVDEPRTVVWKFTNLASYEVQYAFTPVFCPECEHEVGADGGHGRAGCWGCRKPGGSGPCGKAEWE